VISLRFHFLLIFTGLAVIPTLLIATISYFASTSIVKQQNHIIHSATAQRVRDNVEALATRAVNDIRFLEKLSGIALRPLDEQTKILNNLLLASPSYQAAGLIGANGRELIRVSRTSHISSSDLHDRRGSEVFKYPTENKETFFGSIRFNSRIGEPLLTVSAPLINARTGKVDHVLFLDLRFKVIWDLLARLALPPGMDAYVVDGQGLVIAHQDPSVVLRGARISDQESSVSLSGQNVITEKTSIRLAGASLMVVVEQSLEEATALTNQLTLIVITIAAVAFLIALMIFIFYWRRVVLPLQELVHSMDEIGDGGQEPALRYSGLGEVKILAESFARMQRTIKSKIQDLEKYSDELEVRTNELAVEKETADAANKAKSDFLSAMSHDLRTPLNAIMGFSDMMRHKAFGSLGNAHYEMYADDIHHSGALLVSLVNDVLDLAKVESGKYELAEENVDLPELFAVCIRQLTTPGTHSKIAVVVDIPADLPQLKGDQRALTQILNNLLSNALKFTPSDGKIRVVSALNQDGEIIIKVIDTGIGMSAEGVIKALKPFEQADGAHSKRHEGTGLGLHLCTNFMKLFGGRLEIDSEVGKGTTVSLHFPAERTVTSS
jgi:signal transduction histidine kinase